VPENGLRSGEGMAHNAPHFLTRIGSADGCLAVGEYDGADKGRNESSKQAQRQRMADQIQQDKAPAEPAYISDEICEVLFGKVMPKVHGERHIGLWKLVSHGIGAPYRKRHACDSRGPDIDAYNLDAEFVADIEQTPPLAQPMSMTRRTGRGSRRRAASTDAVSPRKRWIRVSWRYTWFTWASGTSDSSRISF
jgi:hypothetical protein